MIEYQPVKDMYKTVSKIIATLFFIGYLPYAPGTFGTLAAMLFIWILKPSFLCQFVIVSVTLIIGSITSGIAEKAFGEKDSRHIVIDEFAGYLCSVIFLPLTPAYMVAAFFLFRFFDILKPPPIRTLERIGGGVGVMCDDVAAGIVANVLLQVLRLTVA
jgi:phosphatidylglycerophosphatase A